MLPFEKEDGYFKDAPVRELLAAALSPEVRDMQDDMIQVALLHCVVRDDHDTKFREILTKLDTSIQSLEIDEDVCPMMTIATMELVMLELIRRIHNAGEQDEFFDKRKN